MTHSLEIMGLPNFPLVRPGADLVRLITEAIEKCGYGLRDWDVLVIAQKIVSKAEGRIIDLAAVKAGSRALHLGEETGKDPRLVEVILNESRRVVRRRPGVLIVEHRCGFILANAGVDQSNVEHGSLVEPVLLLPEDPDGSAQLLHQGLVRNFGRQIGVIVADSFGRAWRLGTIGTAIGTAGLPSLVDLRGRTDLFGRELQSSETGFADEIAAAASLIMGQADEGLPVVLVRGLRWSVKPSPAAALLRTPAEDLFR